MTERHEEIAQRAYRMWEEAGRPEGQDAAHWAAAEAELATVPAREDGGDIAPPAPSGSEAAADTPSTSRGSGRSKPRP